MNQVNLQASNPAGQWFQIPLTAADLRLAEPLGAGYRIANLPARCSIQLAMWEKIADFAGDLISNNVTFVTTDNLLQGILASLNTNTGGNAYLTVSNPVSFSADRILYINPGSPGGFGNLQHGSGVLHVFVVPIPAHVF